MGVVITDILTSSLNHVLESDIQSKQKLIALKGRSIGFDFKGLPIQLLATITPEGMEFSPGSINGADCVLRGTPIALARYLNTKQVNPSTNATLGVEIEGDLEFARQVSTVFRQLDIDWESIFAQVLGDMPAHQLFRIMTNFRAGFDRSKDSAQQHMRYLVTEKLDQVVFQDEVENFYKSVDQLAADASRIEQKINKLIEANTHG